MTTTLKIIATSILFASLGATAFADTNSGFVVISGTVFTNVTATPSTDASTLVMPEQQVPSAQAAGPSASSVKRAQDAQLTADLKQSLAMGNVDQSQAPCQVLGANPAVDNPKDLLLRVTCHGVKANLVAHRQNGAVYLTREGSNKVLDVLTAQSFQAE